MKNYWGTNVINRHYYILKDDITKPNINTKFDLVICISTLEHIPHHNKAVKEMFKLLNPDGYLILTFPYNENEFIDNVYKLSGINNRRYICQAFSRNIINKWLRDNNGVIIAQEYYRAYTGKYWSLGDWITPPQKVTNYDHHDLTCILIKKVDGPKKENDGGVKAGE